VFCLCKVCRGRFLMDVLCDAADRLEKAALIPALRVACESSQRSAANTTHIVNSTIAQTRAAPHAYQRTTSVNR
jgi:hypothetical protein